MRKSLLAFILVLSFVFTAEAQTYLTNVYKPVDSESYKPSSAVKMVGNLTYNSGFVIFNEGWSTFNIEGKWDKLSFVFGHEITRYSDKYVDDDKAVITIVADGVKIFDEVLSVVEVPEDFVLDVKGVRELTFRMVVGTHFSKYAAFGDVALWKAGETPRKLSNAISSKAGIIELTKDLMPYTIGHVGMSGMYCIGPSGKVGYDDLHSVKINGKSYDYGLLGLADMALIGESTAGAHFYVRRQYEKLSFIVGPTNNGIHGTAWATVRADGKIIYEEEVRHDDIARQVVLDIPGCDALSFEVQRIDGGKMQMGFVDIMLYPEDGQVNVSSGEASVDPRLKALPDVTKLVSQVKPFAVGSDLEKQIYDGSSDHLTFSMGGTRYSEGFILYERASFMDDNIESYTVFDLGNEFDYLRFTVGFVGKSWSMNNDMLYVHADDEVVLSVPLMATDHPKEFIVPIRKCRRLKFSNKGQGQFDGTAAYAIADAVVYRGNDTSVNPFVHPKPAFPHEIDLLDLGKPYIHYITAIKTGEKTLHDGSTKKEYFEMPDGSRIYKGFTLKTSIHFSLDMGPLAGKGDNVASVAAGAVAAGASFVPIAAVGNAVIGSTLAGAAALLVLAAGGTAVENSCAAFNTYGEYNSVQFKVACQEYAFSETPGNYTETLLIGVDGKVVQELTLYEAMEPQTITIPIDGCTQLMFWLANTNKGWSGKYVFYDLKLTKDRLALDIPRAARHSEAVVTEFAWDAPDEMPFAWQRPASSGEKTVDSYLRSVSNAYDKTARLLDYAKPENRVHTTFLETAAGQVCKAVRLYSASPNYNHQSTNTGVRIPYYYESVVKYLQDIQKLQSELRGIEIEQANANLALVNLGLKAVSYGKVVKSGGATLKEIKKLLRLMEAQKKAEADFLREVLNKAVDIDGVRSTENTIFCPVFAGDEVPEGGLMAVEVFYMPEN